MNKVSVPPSHERGVRANVPERGIKFQVQRDIFREERLDRPCCFLDQSVQVQNSGVGLKVGR
jgi:hypothetical protein